MDVVACIEIAVQHSFELAADQLFDHFACPRVMVLVVTHAGGTHAPDVAIAAILAPARLISLHRRTGADLLFEGIEGGLYMVLDPMQQFDNLANAHPEAMHGQQIVSELPNGQARHRPQVGNDTGKTHPNASLAQDLLIPRDTQ